MKQEELNDLIESHGLWVASSGKEGKRIDLSKVSLRGLRISGANLKLARFSEVCFTHTTLYNTALKETEFSSCDFSFSEIELCNFEQARVIRSVFEVTTFVNTRFNESYFEDSTFNRSAFSGNIAMVGNKLIRTTFNKCLFYKVNEHCLSSMPQLREIYDRTAEDLAEEIRTKNGDGCEDPIKEDSTSSTNPSSPFQPQGDSQMSTEAPSSELKELASKIIASKIPREHKDKLTKELRKLAQMPPMSSEATTQRVYLDTVLGLPWGEASELERNLSKAEELLENEHYGLAEVKERVLEYLAVNQYTQATGSNGTVLCLAGPPGVGKSSIVASIAKATGRELVTVALGGVSDEAEIRGHRRTYVGSMPGRIIAALKKAGTVNPVILLDEIDKLSKNNRGDPEAALLEVLDPAQNTKFIDHYIDLEVDLSNVMFIATANDLSEVSHPLRDRLEIVTLTGYTKSEKIKIGTKHLANKVFKETGLSSAKLSFSDEAVREVVSFYTQESGVRSLKKQMGRVCRKIVKAAVDGKSDLVTGKNRNLGFKNADKGMRKVITKDIVSKLLGERLIEEELKSNRNEVGFAQGLAYNSSGGCLVPIEAVITKGKGSVKVTGRLGETIKESIQTALTYVQTKSEILALSDDFFYSNDIHIHFPDGSTPKDGPSAGLAIATAITSAVTGIPYDRNVGGTGEIDLRGNALPIGGVKEKLNAACAAGITKIFISQANAKDLKTLAEETKNALDIHLVTRAEQVILMSLDFTVSDKARQVKANIEKALGLNSSDTDRLNQVSEQTLLT